jgi:spermidine/putrescine ABC transporter ATP-binding subunit
MTSDLTGRSLESAGAEVNLRALVKRFGEVIAVDGITLAIEAGEFLTLLGPSGSGKTTTLLMIAGFQLPTEGEVIVDDHPITYKPPHKRNVGMVFQNYALFPHMTVAQNISFPLEMRKVKKKAIEAEVESVLQIVRLTGYGDRYPRQLSGGQQQRIALARAIVFCPRILLMDEPLGALDKKLREEMQLEIKHIQESLGITVIYVTHDQEEALTMSDRIAVMNQGRIEQVGPPVDLYEHPSNLFVADFIGESNVFKGQVVEVSDGTCTIRLTDDQLLLSGPSAQEIASGQDLHFVVRPERIRFVSDPQTMPNEIEGTVKEVVYVGDTTKYEVDFGLGRTLFLKEHSRPGARGYRRQDQVRVGWQTTDVVSLGR